MTSKKDGRKIYLEDMSVGDTFRSGNHLIDADQIVRFAQQFDPQPFHLEEQAAASTLFKGLAASGWHTAAITMRLMVDSLPFSHGLIGADASLSWPRATRPGDVLRVESEILEIRMSKSKPGQAFVTIQHLTLNQHNEVCQKSVTKILAFSKTVA